MRPVELAAPTAATTVGMWRSVRSSGGFSGAMNPGMHQGFSGWNGMTCTP